MAATRIDCIENMNASDHNVLGHQYRQISKMFNGAQMNRLIELVQENEHRLFPNKFNKPNRATSRRAWSTISHIFNAEFPEDKKTPEQIRIKWKNMRQKAKESGQLHLLVKPRRYSNSELSDLTSSSITNLNQTPSLNSSISNVLRIFYDHTDNNNGLGPKTERESSIVTVSSEPDSESSISVNKLNSHSFSSEPTVSTNVQIEVIEGPPLTLPSENGNKHSIKDEDLPQRSCLNPLKRRGTMLDDDITEMKRNLLAEELQNAKKIGVVLNEVLVFLKRLNQSGDVVGGLKENGY